MRIKSNTKIVNRAPAVKAEEEQLLESMLHCL